MCFASNASKVVGQRGGSDPAVCASSGAHDWLQERAAVLFSKKEGWRKVKPRHPKLRREVYPRVCKLGDACPRSDCMFPHIEEEVHLWHYMGKYNIKTIDGVISQRQASQGVNKKHSTSSNNEQHEQQNQRSSTDNGKKSSVSSAVAKSQTKAETPLQLQRRASTPNITAKPLSAGKGSKTASSGTLLPVSKTATIKQSPQSQPKGRASASKMTETGGTMEGTERSPEAAPSSSLMPATSPESKSPHGKDSTPDAKKTPVPTTPSFRHPIKYVCGICFERHGRSGVVEQRTCNGVKSKVCASQASHAWKQFKIVAMFSDTKKRWCKVRPRHHKLRPTVQPQLCTRGEACPRSDCMFPHIKEEIELWVYMADHKMKTLAEVISAGKESTEDTKVQSDVSKASHPAASAPSEEHCHPCSYCNKSYPASWQLEQHIQTKEHWSKVNSDEDKKDQWKQRDPPWNVVNGQYQECLENKRDSCVFTDCTKAHSKEELEEWMERHRYRMMKVRKAKERKLYAFMDEVLEKYNSSTKGRDVIAEELPGIHVKCSEDLTQYLIGKGKDQDSAYTWTFTIKVSDTKSLKRVCLFYDENRHYFRLSRPANESEAQVCPGNLIVEQDGRTYQIDVIFRSQILGSFSQWVLFDLGSEPYLARKLKVQVGLSVQHEIFDETQEEVKPVVVWNSSNSEIVRIVEEDYQLSFSEEKLLSSYRVPATVGIDDLKEMSRENYREFMHRMLYLEELECNRKISKFSTDSTLKCLDTIYVETSTGTVTKFSVDGSKYGILDLKTVLMDDSETSQIIERSVRKIMLQFGTSEKIYEAAILLDQDELGRHKQETLHVKLSPTCVSDQNLQNGTPYQVKVQLQLNRLPFCYMHSAVDRLKNMDMVFPPKDKPQQLPTLSSEMKHLSDPHQNQALRFVSDYGGRSSRQMTGLGPVLVLGPFGTGKTHTLAMAVQRTLQLRPESKILICTQTNSAADLYITEHLDALVEKGSIDKMVRVCAKYRNIRTIPATVKRYVPIQNGEIQPLTADDIKASTVVITTLITSFLLESLELYGHFTHILIDEAGQALEAEVLQPLTLATEKTCVVLAGDHLQISPKVFSRTARHAKFHISLLERLFYQKVGRVMLSQNYRTCQEMLDFMFGAFYSGTRVSQQMKAVVSHEPHPRSKHPLVFCTVKGVDQRIGMSYINHYEVTQIGLIVKDLHDTWPKDKWGELNKNSVGIITPYTMQVRQIRNELRKLRLGNITVDRIHNVQGQQYRVLIISPVRTRSTINKADMTSYLPTISPANHPDDAFDYGFLSDPRLLNAACTRAQSLLMVVGDPSTLCSVGDCSQIWRRYLKECEKNGTLLGTSVAEIQHEIEAAKKRLNPCAAEFNPCGSWVGTPTPLVNDTTQKLSQVSEAPVLTEVDTWLQEDDSTIPDGILHELHRQITEDQCMLEETDATPDMDDEGSCDRKAPAKSKRKGHKYRMIQKSDRIILAFNCEDKPKRHGEHRDDDSDFEKGLKNDEHNERERKRAYEQVKEQPEKYKICSFHCEESGHTYAVPLDEGSSGKILITSKRRRGRALNQDEVIVEIIDDSDVLGLAESENKKCYGKVICICKRAARSALMMDIVCKLDEHMNNLMVPLDRTLPKLYIWSHNQEKSGKKGNKYVSPDFSTVSVYQYGNNPNGPMPFLENVKISRKDRQHTLFLVRYQKWLAALPYPIGAVTEVLPLGDNRENGLRILKLMHGVRDNWKPGVIEEVVEQFPDDWQIPKEELQTRYDARNQIVFTIDPPESQDLDDALSIESKDDNYVVGIHIADVSFFVSKDSPVDKEAKNRATSFYPPFDNPVNMFPERISNEVCSLLPDQDRLTVSVLAVMDKNGSIVGETKLTRSVIRSRRRLTYYDAEKIIGSNSSDREGLDTLEEKICTLSKLANARRRIRLGVGYYAFPHDTEKEEAQCPLAHSLVEEMMLLANQAVAIFLIEVYPDCSPLKRQLAPSDENVNDWVAKHGQHVVHSLELQSKSLPTTELDSNEAPRQMKVLKEKWDEIRTAVTQDAGQDQMASITDLITSDENHPQLGAAKANYLRIQERSGYINSGDYPGKSRHHTLKMDLYTHFTSPIRRYFDLVVHRMLVAAINDENARDRLHQSERPYSDSEIAELAHHCNYQHFNSRAFEKKTFALQYALRLREAPLLFKVFLTGFSDAGLDLLYPYRAFLPMKCPLNLLKPTSRPEISENDIRMQLQWKERVYELHHSEAVARQIHVSSHSQGTICTLDSETNVQISTEIWQELLQGIQAQNLTMIRQTIMDAENDQLLTRDQKKREKRRRRKCNIIEEVTCETSDAKKPLPFVNFKRDFQRGDVVQVQLKASIQKGVLMPSHQLFCLTPKLNLCTEHRANAIESFSSVAAHRPPARIKSIQKYQAVWLPILKMVSAYDAVLSDETSGLHGVDIEWKCSQDADNQPVKFCGVFEVKKMFCHNRNIKLRSGDFICIRYKDLPLDPNTKHSLLEFGNTSPSRGSFTVDRDKNTFVAHAVVSSVEDVDIWTDSWKLIVHVLVNQHSAPFPDALIVSKKVSKKISTASTISFTKRLESAVIRLDKAEQLTKDICLHQNPKVDQCDTVLKRMLDLGRRMTSFEIPNSPFPLPNKPQQDALKLALQQQFTIIQGPPGTGKTITGAHLTYFFTEVNKQLPNSGRGPPQVLYCGPSNKSVDVVAHYLLKLGISVIRVYNHLVEQQDYPLPGHGYGSSKIGHSQEAKMDPDLRHISLHYLIRQKANSCSELIREYDRKFQQPHYKIGFHELHQYKKLIHGAEAEELRKYKVVLCTCNEAGSGRVQNYLNVIQCIVDEAGMCSEPETLIPLVGTAKEVEEPNSTLKKLRHSPRQVVLIGDHKQLRPIIQERTAVELGMEISLLEKYGEEVTMLTIQYRMHESICAFPSEAFYKGKLVTDASVKRREPRLAAIWPGGRENPLVFCHHVGVEEIQSVRTEEGNEQSKGNSHEVKHVVRIVSVMVNRLGVKPDSLVVLAQYRLQKALIEEKLKEANLENVTVSTVITSQGREWDFVILSTVRSLPRVEIDDKPSPSWMKRNLGFICDENQMNVAITRPRMGLIILGNRFLLRVHKTWEKLLNHYHEKGAVVFAENFLKGYQ
ncbi:helicase with zinc finger domain 2-like [Acanthaster planci]|uniref:Helicase with zinc finger domain 2-like n=1 Tax=Acanthaster planci TaxID=133434 RepID=A0A8B8A2Y0_ACAPL|nr:helicase with zinc finger domain 2-like [Acanthaster planci]